MPLFLLSLALLFHPLPSPRSDANAIRHAIERRYREARTLRAEFYEQYSDGHGGGTAESGVVYFSRPDRMRWEYESPQKKLFLVDGTNVWYYVPADHVASRARMKQSSDWRTPIALLAGKADLDKVCRSIQVVNSTDDPSEKPLDPEDSVLLCKPRGSRDNDQNSIESVLFEVQPDGFLSRILIRQPGNLQIEFRFGKWEENLDLPETLFHFSPPPGVSIVDEQSLLNSMQ
ncbi:MAG TPA: outer-membrane lipoprotein carrier protein LolA [Verrucomicrobiae bacterium]|nr:outer-membrane lipoprotein carrier protein LolA [Verrucomicrobiae bacterium]